MFLCLGITSGGLGGSFGVVRIEPNLVACKKSTLAAVLLSRPLILYKIPVLLRTFF